MAKRAGSIYLPGRRSPDSRKIKLMNTQACVIVGWTPGKGGRGRFLRRAARGCDRHGDRGLRWVGQVGLGFHRAPCSRPADGRTSRSEGSTATARDRGPGAGRGQGRHLRGARTRVRGPSIWSSRRARGRCAHPSFRGMRPEVLPADCVLEPPGRFEAGAGHADPGGGTPPAPRASGVRRRAPGRVRACRSPDRRPRPKAARPSRYSPAPEAPTAVANGRGGDVVGHLGDRIPRRCSPNAKSNDAIDPPISAPPSLLDEGPAG